MSLMDVLFLKGCAIECQKAMSMISGQNFPTRVQAARDQSS
jgi:hypothetical protein